MALQDIVLTHKRATSNIDPVALDFDTSAGSIVTFESVVQQFRDQRSEWSPDLKQAEGTPDGLAYTEMFAAYCSGFNLDYERPTRGSTAILQLAAWLSMKLVSRRILASDVPEEVTAAVESSPILKECFWTILAALKIRLQWSRVDSFRVRNLVDPEGSGLRIHFEVGTSGWTREERKSLKRELRQTVDSAVRGVISIHGLGEAGYIESRVVFGVSVGVEARED